ncbi:MAG: DUF2851 family protein [Bacteroidetes bacterium]|nr:MAG: DUF2851 family protein [Bacteroidota bacterium]
MTHERFLQIAWKNGLFPGNGLKTLQGEPVTIVHPGDQNHHAGPDFFNARIRIGSILWAGNVELHQRASDWNRHGHNRDPLYNNVILHVVLVPDDRVFNSLGRMVPCLVLRDQECQLPARDSSDQDPEFLPCIRKIRQIPPVHIELWRESLFYERLVEKSGRIASLLEQKKGDWEETLYISLASGYGLPVNPLPFEMLASGLPLSSLIRWRDDRTALEALLFGQSGLLEPAPGRSSYVRHLRGIYRELVHPRLKPPVPGYLWKFLRLRPASFPTLRISQFAGLVNRNFPEVKEILNPVSLTEMERMFRTRASGYWENHYVFGKASPRRIKYTGSQCILSLIINSIVPFLTAYGLREKKKEMVDLGKDLLREISAESNHLLDRWNIPGMKPVNALESQALIQLHNRYCVHRRCPDCMLGEWCIGHTSTG